MIDTGQKSGYNTHCEKWKGLEAIGLGRVGTRTKACLPSQPGSDIVVIVMFGTCFGDGGTNYWHNACGQDG